MNDNLPDDTALLRQRLAEQVAQILALEAKLDDRERQPPGINALTRRVVEQRHPVMVKPNRALSKPR
ncbi:hypothetical protein [Pantoea sp. SORGH_AS_0659]|uniref:hypothetical protein n=1 Tax=Pantoea sp. SORGH_AS_0659 TaxID=3062597 RepID=UPI0028601FAC|nr:hypothetical protein [Pantoea sp. SORGH_AS_0659]MDR6352591.1 hypothetical protein [Pantoea sp. SORGH_AS_0659]